MVSWFSYQVLRRWTTLPFCMELEAALSEVRQVLRQSGHATSRCTISYANWLSPTSRASLLNFLKAKPKPSCWPGAYWPGNN